MCGVEIKPVNSAKACSMYEQQDKLIYQARNFFSQYPA